MMQTGNYNQQRTHNRRANMKKY